MLFHFLLSAQILKNITAVQLFTGGLYADLLIGSDHQFLQVSAVCLASGLSGIISMFLVSYVPHIL